MRTYVYIHWLFGDDRLILSLTLSLWKRSMKSASAKIADDDDEEKPSDIRFFSFSLRDKARERERVTRRAALYSVLFTKLAAEDALCVCSILCVLICVSTYLFLAIARA